jgi:hypothetical protein
MRRVGCKAVGHGNTAGMAVHRRLRCKLRFRDVLELKGYLVRGYGMERAALEQHLALAEGVGGDRTKECDHG